MKIVLNSLYQILAQKATWGLSSLLAMLAAFFLPIETYIFCAFLACFADWICGWAAAAKRDEGFSGKKVRESLIKLLLYVTVTAAFFHISHSLHFPVDVTYFVVSMISVAEMMSILRNVGDYTGYDYEAKVKEFAPFLAKFLPKSKNVKDVVLLAFLLLSTNFLRAQIVPIRPDQAPILTNPSAANAEVYSQKGGTALKRIPYDILQKTIAPKAQPTPTINYTPTPTGNPIVDRNKIVAANNGLTYFIDWDGRAIVCGNTGSNYTAGTGIQIVNGVITNIGDLLPTNEIQTLSKPSAGTLKLTNGANASTYIFLPDSLPTNELQTLSLSGNILSLSNGGNVTLPAGSVYTAGSGVTITGSVIAAKDTSIINELQNLSISGQSLSISGGNTVTLPSATNYTAGSGISIVANAIMAADTSAINEIQSISISGQTLTLNKSGGSVQIPYTDWSNVPNKPSTFPPSTHTHVQSQVTNLTDSLNVRSRVGHTHSYSALSGIPSTFTPSTHTHVQSQVTNLSDSLNVRSRVGHTHAYSSLSGIPSTFTPSTHTHTIANVTNLQDSLSNKSDVGHTHNYLSSMNLTTQGIVGDRITNFTDADNSQNQIEYRFLGSTVSYQSFVAGGVNGLNRLRYTVIPKDTSNTNEIELPTIGLSTGMVATWNGSNWTGANPTSGADNWGSQVVARKQTELVGDGTSIKPLGLRATGVTAGTYNSVTVDTTGRVTTAANVSTAYSSLTGIPSTFTPSTHSHPQSQVTNLTDSLAVKSRVGHTHDYTNLINKPTIPAAQVNSDWNSSSGVSQILNKPTTFTPSTHSHPQSQVTNLTDSLAVKSRIGHAHTINQVTNLQDSLNARSRLNHIHAYNTLTGIPSTFTPSTHTHVQSQVTNLTDSLNVRSRVGHTHDYTTLTNKPTIPTTTSQLTNNSGFLTSMNLTTQGIVGDRVTNFADADNSQNQIEYRFLGSDVTYNTFVGGGVNGLDRLRYTVTPKDTSNTNELQTLSLSGSDLTLSNGGGTIALPSGGGGSGGLTTGSIGYSYAHLVNGDYVTTSGYEDMTLNVSAGGSGVFTTSADVLPYNSNASTTHFFGTCSAEGSNPSDCFCVVRTQAGTKKLQVVITNYGSTTASLAGFTFSITYKK